MFTQKDYDNFGKTFIPERDAFPAPQMEVPPSSDLVKTFPCAPAYRIPDYETQPMTFQPPRSGGMGTGLTGDVNNIPSIASARRQPAFENDRGPQLPDRVDSRHDPRTKGLKKDPTPSILNPTRNTHPRKKYIDKAKKDLKKVRTEFEDFQAKINYNRTVENVQVCSQYAAKKAINHGINEALDKLRKPSSSFSKLITSVKRNILYGFISTKPKYDEEFNRCMKALDDENKYRNGK